MLVKNSLYTQSMPPAGAEARFAKAAPMVHERVDVPVLTPPGSAVKALQIVSPVNL
jgi:hypothetical protein